MKKENFITLLLGTVSGLVFALGMCMCLLPEWGIFNIGVGFGIVGVIGIIITILVYRKMSGKQPIKVNAKTVGKIIYGVFASLVFGTGLGLVLAFEALMIPGILVGLLGIILLLFLIPMCVGLKK